jgi:hypothetical protein
MTRRGLCVVAFTMVLLVVGGGCRKDECERGEDDCDLLTECIATPDGHVCTACPIGWEDVDGDGTQCEENDECATGMDNCAPEVSCTNEEGGFTCGACPSGYQDTNGDGTLCDDVDECDAGTDACDVLAGCINVIGGFFCGTCPAGYDDTYGDGTECVNIDECALGIDNCDPAVTCTDVDGGFECGCCPSGYGDPYGDGSVCVDEDECALEEDDCDPLAGCINLPGGFECGPCPPGYDDRNGDGTLCEWGCGNGLRRPLEGCDDGNLDDGDGCSDECVVEGTSLPVSCSIGFGQPNAMFLTVTDTGVIYFGNSAGGPIRIHSVAPDCTLTQDLFDHDITAGGGVALGEDLYLGGSKSANPWGTFVQKWSPVGGLTTLYFEEIAHYYGFAAADSSTFYLGRPDEIRKVETAATSTVYREFFGNDLTYDPVGERLLAVDLYTIYADNGVDDFEPLYSLPGFPGIPAIDDEGYLYVPCWLLDPWDPIDPLLIPCPGGSVWVIAPDGSQAAPFMDAFALVDEVAWDPAEDELVLLAKVGEPYFGPALFRVPLGGGGAR